MPPFWKYRRHALASSCGFLIFAILTKLYRGPLHVYIDAWAGDIGIVACLYFMLACFFPRLQPFIKGLVIACIAVSVELFQASGIPRSWNLPAPFVWVLGSRFDVMDFWFYFIGIIIAFLIDIKLVKIYER